MSNKAVLEIDVHDEKFQKFLGAFGDLEHAVEHMGAKFPELFNVPHGSTKTLDEITHKGPKAERALDKVGSHMGRLGESAKKAGGHIKGLLGLVTDLGALLIPLSIGGALFGLADLAQRTMNVGKTAAGIGVSTGMKRSFDTNMTPYLTNPDSVLSAVSLARIGGHNVMLGNLGLTSTGLQEESRTKDVTSVIERAVSLYKKNGGPQGYLVDQARHLFSLMSLADYRNLAKIPDLPALLAKTVKEAPSLTTSKAAQAAATKATVSMGLAKQRIETHLANNLVTAFTGLGKAVTTASKDLNLFSSGLIGWADKFRSMFPKGPGGTLAATVTGGAAGYFGIKAIKGLLKSLFGVKGAAGDTAVAGDAAVGGMEILSKVGLIGALLAATGAGVYAVDHPKERHKWLEESRAWLEKEHEKLYHTPLTGHQSQNAAITQAVKEGIREGMKGVKLTVRESPVPLTAHAAAH